MTKESEKLTTEDIQHAENVAQVCHIYITPPNIFKVVVISLLLLRKVLRNFALMAVA